jgi:hypothetical protein
LTDYKGWKVPNEIIIVAKTCRQWNKELRQYEGSDTYQGYVVDPSSADMLASAHNWAAWTEYRGEYDKTTRRYEEQIEHVGVEHRFANEGFTLELLDSADGSRQGGKLSFWNCKISKDDKEFIVGIASDYLLEILKYNDFKRGVCQATLSFARCKGGVGMLNKEMPSYQQYLKDEELRATLSKGKTKKRIPGHLYSTLTGGNVFLSTFYCWYEPVYKKDPHRYYNDTLLGFKRLDKPAEVYWQPWYDSTLKTKSAYLKRGYGFGLDDKVPARTDSGPAVELDISDEEVINVQLRDRLSDDNMYGLTYCTYLIGLATTKDSYELPDWVRQWVTSRGYTIWD